MLLNQHFINYFVRNLYSSWLVFLRVVQKNKSGYFFWTQCIWVYTGWLKKDGGHSFVGGSVYVSGDKRVVSVVPVIGHFEHQPALDHSVVSWRHTVVDDVILDQWRSVLKPRDVRRRISVDLVPNRPIECSNQLQPRRWNGCAHK